MGVHRKIAPESKHKTWTTSARSSTNAEWHDLGLAYRCTLARYARTIWQVDDDLQPLSTLAQVGHLGQDVCRVTNCFGCGEQCGLGSSFHRLHDGSCPSACGGSKKSSPELEAL